MLLKFLAFRRGGLGGLAALRELFFKFSQRPTAADFTLAKAQRRKEIEVRSV
jgi:hypothetical protein